MQSEEYTGKSEEDEVVMVIRGMKINLSLPVEQGEIDQILAKRKSRRK